MGYASQDADGRKALGVVEARLDVYHGPSIAHCAMEHKYQREGDRLLSPPGCRVSQ
jgi:hypothetical protein